MVRSFRQARFDPRADVRRETCFLTHKIPRSAWLGFAAITAFALTLSAESSGASAQKARPLPPGVTACDFNALANDHTPEGLNIRAEPRAARLDLAGFFRARVAPFVDSLVVAR
jgi:hypothetical protein